MSSDFCLEILYKRGKVSLSVPSCSHGSSQNLILLPSPSFILICLVNIVDAGWLSRTNFLMSFHGPQPLAMFHNGNAAWSSPWMEWTTFLHSALSSIAYLHHHLNKSESFFSVRLPTPNPPLDFKACTMSNTTVLQVLFGFTFALHDLSY